MPLSTKRAYIELHIAVFLWGFTAILGKLITLEETALVWWRVLITCCSLLLFPSVWKGLRQYSWSLLLKMMGVGMLVALHWVLFFGSVKYSNVSICLVCMATASFFTAVMEPLIMRYRHHWHELLLGLFIIPGMFLVVNFIPVDKMVGVWMGLAAAFLAAVFSICNKKILVTEGDLDSLSMTFVELSGGWLFLSAAFPLTWRFLGESPFMREGTDWGYLLALALVCTTLAYVLGLRVLKVLSAFASNLVVNLEPVYGMLLALLVFRENEEMGAYFYVGMVVVLVAVFLHPLMVRQRERGV